MTNLIRSNISLGKHRGVTCQFPHDYCGRPHWPPTLYRWLRSTWWVVLHGYLVDMDTHTHTHPPWGLWSCQPPNIVKCFSAFLNCNDHVPTSHLVPSQVASVLTHPLWWRAGRDKWETQLLGKELSHGAFEQPATSASSKCLEMEGRRAKALLWLPGLRDLETVSAEATSRWGWSLQTLRVPKNWWEWLKTGPKSSLQEKRGTWTCCPQLYREQATSGK